MAFPPVGIRTIHFEQLFPEGFFTNEASQLPTESVFALLEQRSLPFQEWLFTHSCEQVFHFCRHVRHLTSIEVSKSLISECAQRVLQQKKETHARSCESLISYAERLSEDARAFFFQWLAGEELPLTTAIVGELFLFAARYQIEPLLTRCHFFCRGYIAPENLCQVCLPIAEFIMDEPCWQPLYYHFLHIAFNHWEEVQRSLEFSCLPSRWQEAMRSVGERPEREEVEMQEGPLFVQVPTTEGRLLSFRQLILEIFYCTTLPCVSLRALLAFRNFLYHGPSFEISLSQAKEWCVAELPAAPVMKKFLNYCQGLLFHRWVSGEFIDLETIGKMPVAVQRECVLWLLLQIRFTDRFSTQQRIQEGQKQIAAIFQAFNKSTVEMKARERKECVRTLSSACFYLVEEMMAAWMLLEETEGLTKRIGYLPEEEEELLMLLATHFSAVPHLFLLPLLSGLRQPLALNALRTIQRQPACYPTEQLIGSLKRLTEGYDALLALSAFFLLEQLGYPFSSAFRREFFFQKLFQVILEESKRGYVEEYTSLVMTKSYFIYTEQRVIEQFENNQPELSLRRLLAVLPANGSFTVEEMKEITNPYIMDVSAVTDFFNRLPLSDQLEQFLQELKRSIEGDGHRRSIALKQLRMLGHHAASLELVSIVIPYLSSPDSTLSCEAGATFRALVSSCSLSPKESRVLLEIVLKQCERNCPGAFLALSALGTEWVTPRLLVKILTALPTSGDAVLELIKACGERAGTRLVIATLARYFTIADRSHLTVRRMVSKKIAETLAAIMQGEKAEERIAYFVFLFCQRRNHPIWSIDLLDLEEVLRAVGPRAATDRVIELLCSVGIETTEALYLIQAADANVMKMIAKEIHHRRASCERMRFFATELYLLFHRRNGDSVESRQVERSFVALWQELPENAIERLEIGALLARMGAYE